MLSSQLADDISNLMLLCDEHHRLIDREGKDNHSVETLQCMKREHEQRIETVTSIDSDRQSHILLYGANVGDHNSPVSYCKAKSAMLLDKRYPASPNPLSLGMVNSSFRDRTEEFWRIESDHLRNMVQQQVRPQLVSGGIEHLSVFALAPQPLLMLLGYLLSDIPAAQVYQLHREPQDWCWQDDSDGFEYLVQKPGEAVGQPALVLSLSATIMDDRISAVLGDDAAIWRVTIPEPNNDFLKSRRQLQQFREIMRQLLNSIKARHGQGAVLHVFPAAPIAVAVEMGRIIMPKADVRLRIYDQNNDLGGFVHALDLATAYGDAQ